MISSWTAKDATTCRHSTKVSALKRFWPESWQCQAASFRASEESKGNVWLSEALPSQEVEKMVRGGPWIRSLQHPGP